MKSTKFLKGTLAISSAALLAACGGGDSAAPEVAWASPAVFVTPGAASKAYNLKDCQRDVYNRKTNQTEQENQPLYKATLVIASNGDMSVAASTTENGTPTTVWSKTFAEAQQISWSVEGTSPTFTYSLYSYTNLRDGFKSLQVYEQTDEDDSIVGYLEGEDYNTDSNTTVECDMADRLALQVNINEARAAKNLGSAAGVTSFDSYDADGRIEGDNAFWYSDSGSSAYQHWRFNLKTGALASSTSTTGTYSTVSFALPTGAGQYGAYAEAKQKNNSYFDYKDANIVCLARDESESGFSLSAAAYGTKFFPQGDRIEDQEQIGALIQPKGGFFFGCGQR